MHLEIELTLTLHTQNDHFIKPRAMMSMDHEDILALLAASSVSFEERVRSSVERAFQTANKIVANAVWDQARDVLEDLDL